MSWALLASLAIVAALAARPSDPAGPSAATADPARQLVLDTRLFDAWANATSRVRGPSRA